MDDSLEERVKKVLLSTLKCSKCQNFLSVVSEDSQQLQCGTCKDVPPGKTLRRSSAFVKIAKELSLPCVHEGCEASVPWNELRKHEEICNERSVKCPLKNHDKCELVKMKKLLEHLQNIHGCNVFFDTVTHKLDDTITEIISVLIFKNHIFFVLVRKGSCTHEIVITMLNNSENTHMSFTYNVRLSNESNDSFILFENQQIVSLEKGKYCLNCWIKKCSLHSNSNNEKLPGCSQDTIKTMNHSVISSLFGIKSVSGIKYSIEIVALQKIAQELCIPCNYEGCEVLVPWNEVQKHEEMCDERSVRCPFNYHDNGCKFVKMKELVEHLQNIHKCNVFCDTLTHESFVTYPTVISVLTFKNHIFLVLTRHRSHYLKILITMLNNSENTDMSFTYNVRLSNDYNDKIVLFENQQIDLLEEGKYCFACWKGTCSFKSDDGNKKPPQDAMKKINLDHIRTSFDGIGRGYGTYSKIKYSIKIVAVENHLKNKEVADKIPSTQMNNLRNMLQCPICMEYMIGHIFNCENGHVLCHTCKTQVKICPTCRVTLGVLRCIPLENQAEFLLLDCSFAEKGCNFSGKVKMLFQHEKECCYRAEDANIENPRKLV